MDGTGSATWEDAHPSGLAHVRRGGRIEFFVGDATAIDRPDASFDNVVFLARIGFRLVHFNCEDFVARGSRAITRRCST